jgi:hypothetical protein
MWTNSKVNDSTAVNLPTSDKHVDGAAETFMSIPTIIEVNVVGITLRVGLVGVSIQSILVFSFILASNAPSTVKSAKSNVTPILTAATLLKKRLVPPYTSSIVITWSPGLSKCKIVVVAADPDENANPKHNKKMQVFFKSQSSV